MRCLMEVYAFLYAALLFGNIRFYGRLILSIMQSRTLLLSAAVQKLSGSKSILFCNYCLVKLFKKELRRAVRIERLEGLCYQI